MRLQDELSQKSARRLAIDALMLGLALLLSYLEALLPIATLIPLPGFRFGWAQIAVTLTFFTVGHADAAIVSATRIVLMGILFGNVSSLWFSACGALLAYAGLWFGLFFLRRCSYIGLGVLCAALHNTGQVIAAAALFGSEVLLSYLPVLLIASIFFGGVGGLMTNAILRRLPTRILGTRTE